MTTQKQGNQMEAQSFKYLNKMMMLLWRLGLGRWNNILPSIFGQIMVIVHTGRKSGQTRYAPLNYAIVDGELYCLSGFGDKAQWYKNIMVNPDVEVWLADGRWASVVNDVTDKEDALVIYREVLKGSGFAAPLLEGINPYRLSDEELAKIVADYRLLHIQRAETVTGPGGPGDLSWVWLPIGLLVLGRMWRKRRVAAYLESRLASQRVSRA